MLLYESLSHNHPHVVLCDSGSNTGINKHDKSVRDDHYRRRVTGYINESLCLHWLQRIVVGRHDSVIATVWVHTLVQSCDVRYDNNIIFNVKSKTDGYQSQSTTRNKTKN